MVMMNASINSANSNSSPKGSPKNSVKRSTTNNKEQAPPEDMSRLSVHFAKKLTRAQTIKLRREKMRAQVMK